MKMDSKRMRDLLKERCQAPDRTISFDREKDTLRIEDSDTKKGVTIELPRLVGKWEVEGDAAIEEMVYYVNEALREMVSTLSLDGKEQHVYPVIRSTSFPKESKEGVSFVTDEHTAETRIYYAVDLGNTYRLVDEQTLQKYGWTKDRIREIARFHVRSLPTEMKSDEVAGNVFYFLNTNDGYDASRILNDRWLSELKKDMQGEMAVAVPHQDVCIICDIRNQTGYDILAQMTMKFFAEGRVPITALSFLYEDGELEPIFILGKQKSKE